MQIPELNVAQCDSRIRIPGELDVPVSHRILRIIDAPGMQRLKRISQLGLVSQVYPGANHSRFEHSLGVYRLACQVLNHLLANEPSFAHSLTEKQATVFLLAALLHDIGHWPYCHPIEDLGLEWIPRHESLARELICNSEIAALIERDWSLPPADVADFLANADSHELTTRVLQNVLGGPIDIDKMDYLQRDSLHAGVPYGRNFDLGRLISSQCLGGDGSRIAITEKGKTAAEMMVFARYVMFSEVYWHHTVRSATAMLQRLVFELSTECDPLAWIRQSDAQFGTQMLQLSRSSPGVETLADALFGQGRRLFKRRGQFHFNERAEIHERLAGRPYPQLVQVAEQLSEWLNARCGTELKPTDVLIDAPPTKLEVQFRLEVKTTQSGRVAFVPLESVSPVVKALATEQFDNYVKRVRIFVNPEQDKQINVSPAELEQQLIRIAEQLN